MQMRLLQTNRINYCFKLRALHTSDSTYARRALEEAIIRFDVEHDFTGYPDYEVRVKINKGKRKQVIDVALEEIIRQLLHSASVREFDINPKMLKSKELARRKLCTIKYIKKGCYRKK